MNHLEEAKRRMEKPDEVAAAKFPVHFALAHALIDMAESLREMSREKLMVNDPIEQLMGQAFAMAERDFEFYADKLVGIVNAYRGSINRFERQDLLRRVTKGMVESENTREDLCHMLVLAIDSAARR